MAEELGFRRKTGFYAKRKIVTKVFGSENLIRWDELNFILEPRLEKSYLDNIGENDDF